MESKNEKPLIETLNIRSMNPRNLKDYNIASTLR